MAEKSLVNDVAEMLGVELVDELVGVELVDDLFELPHAAIVTAAATPITTSATRLLSKCMNFPPQGVTRAAHTSTLRSHGFGERTNPRSGAVNEP
jgi:hypothetical protein